MRTPNYYTSHVQQAERAALEEECAMAKQQVIELQQHVKDLEAEILFLHGRSSDLEVSCAR